jgi:hypothetical protein
MCRYFFFIVFFLLAVRGEAQTAKDLFNQSDVKIRWLGVDFSHVKLIGDFAQFFSAGEKSSLQIRDNYFSGWNKLILSEPKKYDLHGMLRKETIVYDIDMVTELNSNAPVEDIESLNTPNYTKKDIEDFIAAYNIVNEDGIGIALIAESLNKNFEEAYFHFVAMNLKTKELLIHQRLRGEPFGFGLRNYWAGSIHDVIKEIKNNRYKMWRNKFK